MKYTLHLGDCLEYMATMPDNSVDSIVTDPPYGLRFMSKKWDYDVPSVAIWAECLRILRPGGHMLAFSGSRTYHRMVVNVEDAGFEIRDQIMWVYGSGFPKSMDVSKAIDKMAGAEREVIGQRDRYHDGRERQNKGQTGGDFLGLANGVADITAPATEAAKQWDGYGTALKPAHEIVIMARKPFPNESEHDIILGNLFDYVLRLEAQVWLLLHALTAENNSMSSRQERDAVLDIAQWNVGDLSNTMEDLSGLMDTSPLESMIHTSWNTVSSWRSIWGESLNHGNKFITETVTSQTIGLSTLKSLVSEITPRCIIQGALDQHGQLSNVSHAVTVFSAVTKKLSATLELFVVENAMLKGRIPHPDAIDQNVLNRPIVLARKPIVGTIAANVLEYGTGALNIDDCRVPIADGATMARNNKPCHNGCFNSSDGKNSTALNGEPAGRWPANFIHDGSDEVMVGFPHSAVSGAAKKGKSALAKNEGMFLPYAGNGALHNDTGSAARFFYCAKASKSERTCGGTVDNNHPTVKPQSLMAYLCRLITPPDGLVLDPFMGSGSTGIAALNEGFRFVGIERDADSYTTAGERIATGMQQMSLL